MTDDLTDEELWTAIEALSFAADRAVTDEERLRIKQAREKLREQYRLRQRGDEE